MHDGSGDKMGQGPWFDSPETSYRAEAAKFASRPEIAEAAAKYRETGYLVRDFGFAQADLDEAAAYTKSMKSGRVQDGWLANAAVKRLATDKRVIAFLSDLYQREAFPFQTLNFATGSQQSTHSDTFHFNSKPVGFMCGVWIALEDIHPDSGPLHYYPGSHRLPVFSDTDLGGKDYDTGYDGLIISTIEKAGLKRETAQIRRGETFIWAANLFHGGSKVADSSRTRLSQVTHYYFRGCSYFTPMASKAEAGKVFWREPFDIAAGRFVANAGKDQRPGLKYRLGERLKIWTKRPYAS